MKKIAITQRLIVHNDYFEIREALDINYCKLLFSCGFIPIVLPYEVDFNYYFKEFDIKGVFLTGGNDLYVCSSDKLSFKRDLYEKNLLKYCIDEDIPVFGICRGMQLIADYFKCDFKKINGHINRNHSLIINEDSLYIEELKKINIVNSYHNFAINSLSKHLKVSANSDDGEIEAIEHKRYRIFAQMWHPERNKPFNEDEINLIKEFFK